MPVLRIYRARYAHIEALAERGLLEFALIDPGSVNFTPDNDNIGGKAGRHLLNPEDHVRYVLDFAARHRLHPDFAIYEPGFMRAGAALARAAGTRVPIYRFMFCNQIAVGFPPKPMRYRPIWRCWRRKRPARPG